MDTPAAAGSALPAVIAASVAAVVAAINVVVTWRTRRTDRAQRQRERSQDLASRSVERAEMQRREVYTTFVQAVEVLTDTVDRLISAGPIRKYQIDMSFLESLKAQGADDDQLRETPTPENPIPQLDSAAIARLDAMAIEARTARVMVEIVGPEAVGNAAMEYERALAACLLPLIQRDVTVAEAYHQVRGPRSAFVEAARLALMPVAAGSDE